MRVCVCACVGRGKKKYLVSKIVFFKNDVWKELRFSTHAPFPLWAETETVVCSYALFPLISEPVFVFVLPANGGAGNTGSTTQ